MGLLTAITIGFALIADFLLLPTLLMTIDKRGMNEEDSVADPA
jgi:predicted RND superfamily exporter protein